MSYSHLFQLMGEEQDLDPEITREFFENQILHFDPSLLTENGMTYVAVCTFTKISLAYWIVGT